MAEIHPTAIVNTGAELSDSVTVGPFTIIEDDVVIGSGTQILSHARIASGARIGKECIIHHGAVLGTIPQDLKFSGEKTTIEIGDRTVIREYCMLNRGTKHSGTSLIGSDSLLMAYCHVAHDCFVGDHVILANGVQLAGHVTIEDWAIVGGLVPIHQFCTVGCHVMIGGGYRVVQDVPPYIMAASEPLGFKGVNVIGLRRRGFEKEAIDALRRCYRLIYRSKLNLTQAKTRIHEELELTPEISHVLDFIQQSERGIIR